MTMRVIRANLRLLPIGAGGRVSPIKSGYRSLVHFDDIDTDFGFELALDAESLSPGESGNGRLTFWAVEELPELVAGQSFELREGKHVVGQGTVLEP